MAARLVVAIHHHDCRVGFADQGVGEREPHCARTHHEVVSLDIPPHLSDGSEEFIDVFNKQLGLLERREVAAARHRREVGDVVPGLAPAAGRLQDLLRERRDTGGQFDALEAAEEVEALPVQPRRRRALTRSTSTSSRCRASRRGERCSRDGRRSPSTTRTSRRSTPAGRPANRPSRSRASAAAWTVAWSSRSPSPRSACRAERRLLLGCRIRPVRRGESPSGMFR